MARDTLITKADSGRHHILHECEDWQFDPEQQREPHELKHCRVCGKNRAPVRPRLLSDRGRHRPGVSRFNLGRTVANIRYREDASPGR